MTKHIQLTEVLSIGFVHLYAFSISIPKGVWALFCLCVCVCVCVCLQHSRARTADGHVAQLDDQRGGILWEVRQISRYSRALLNRHMNEQCVLVCISMWRVIRGWPTHITVKVFVTVKNSVFLSFHFILPEWHKLIFFTLWF